MFSSFICGTFHPREEEGGGGGGGLDHESFRCSSSPEEPKKSRRKSGFGTRRASKESRNPFSSQGLDKFYALMSDLEEKKKEIYLQKGSKDIAFIRFAASRNSGEFVPVVVKSKDKKNKELEKMKRKIEMIRKTDKDMTTQHLESETKEETPSAEVKELQETVENKQKTKLKKSFSLSWYQWRRPSFYIPLVIILILLLLALFGRSFAIMCTSIGWYIVPTLTGGSSNNMIAQVKRRWRARTHNYHMGITEAGEDDQPLLGISSPRLSNI